MELDLEGIVVIVGDCGSGKTEVSINLALNHMARGRLVKIADLDLVNPYFRAREVRSFLKKFNIQVAIPPDEYFHADLPILTPLISGMIKDSPELLILDTGGGGIGSTVLGSLAGFLEGKLIRVLHVINPKRPFTSTVEGCLRLRDEIELAAKIRITGIIGNTNLIMETSPENVYDGYAFVSEVSQKAGVPVCCVTASAKILSSLDFKKVRCPVLPLWRQLVPPWMASEGIKS